MNDYLAGIAANMITILLCGAVFGYCVSGVMWVYREQKKLQEKP